MTLSLVEVVRPSPRVSQSAVQLSQMTRRFDYDYSHHHEYTEQGAHLVGLVGGDPNPEPPSFNMRFPSPAIDSPCYHNIQFHIRFSPLPHGGGGAPPNVVERGKGGGEM